MDQQTIVDHRILEKAELLATQTVTQEFSDRLVFHDASYIQRIANWAQKIGEDEGLDEEALETTVLAAWFVKLGLKELDSYEPLDSPMDLFEQCAEHTLKLINSFFEENNYPKEKAERVVRILKEGVPGKEITDPILEAQVLHDAVTVDYGLAGAKKRVETLYNEFLLTDAIQLDKKSFFETISDYLSRHEYKTTYGKENLEPAKQKLIKKLGKEYKSIQQTEDEAVKKELGISDAELKKLKKTLNSVKGRDERGIQTMFRTTTKNHYTLNEMVDRKASIMISVNAIILSLILGKIIGEIDTICIHNSPILFMLITSAISITFAVMAIRPNQTHGEFTEDQVRNKQGNLLYFGNFHNMKFRDYEWGMLQMLNDGDYLYTTMIRDLYFMGQQLSKKYRYIRNALGIFLIGLVVATGAFIILSAMGEVHINGTH